MHFIDKILDPISRGWINVLRQNNREVYIYYGTRIELLGTENSYQKILIKEGLYKGQIVNIPYKTRSGSINISYLTQVTQTVKPATLFLDVKKQTLYSPAIGEFRVMIKKDVLSGLYYLQLPDYPHPTRITKEYLDEKMGGSRFSETWFRVVSENSQTNEVYLHFGKYSEGCVTVLYDSKSKDQIWNKIYLYLINSRLDHTHVGSLEVI